MASIVNLRTGLVVAQLAWSPYEAGVPPSSRSAFRPQPHVALQPRQYRRLRPGQPVNVAL